jgi:hypothetical protein
MKTTTISKETYPLLYKGWLMIQLDSGAINRHEPQKHSFETAERPDELAIAEAQLAQLSDEELETFCIGEESESYGLQDKYGLDEANYIFVEWFG